VKCTYLNSQWRPTVLRQTFRAGVDWLQLQRAAGGYTLPPARLRFPQIRRELSLDQDRLSAFEPYSRSGSSGHFARRLPHVFIVLNSHVRFGPPYRPRPAVRHCRLTGARRDRWRSPVPIAASSSSTLRFGLPSTYGCDRFPQARMPLLALHRRLSAAAAASFQTGNSPLTLSASASCRFPHAALLFDALQRRLPHACKLYFPHSRWLNLPITFGYWNIFKAVLNILCLTKFVTSSVTVFEVVI